MVLTSTPLLARFVPNEWRRLYIGIDFRAASRCARLKPSRMLRPETGRSPRSPANTKSPSPVANSRCLTRPSARVRRGVIGIGANPRRLRVIRPVTHPVVVRTDHTRLEINGAPPQPQSLAGKAKTSVRAAQPERLLEISGGLLQKPLELGSVEVIIAPQDAAASRPG